MMDPDSAGSRSSAFARVERIWKAATADADAVTERLLLAERAAATARFETFWPTSTPSRPQSLTRRTLRDWYVRVVENQLARGLNAPVRSPIDGAEAEKTIAIVSKRTGADSPVVVDAVIELARDARVVANRVAQGRKDYVDAALRGRISQLFPRSPEYDVAIRQALAEQWYARAFRARAEPPLYRKDTSPITAAEINAVAVSLATGQARVLYRNSQPIGPATPEGWRAHTAKEWASLSRKSRSEWLTERGYDSEFAEVSFQHLPLMIKSELLGLYQPIQPVISQPLAIGPPIDAAAEAFGASPIIAASERYLRLASILFSPRGVTLPQSVMVDLPDIAAVRGSLVALRSASHDRAEFRGHRMSRSRWLDDDQRDQALRMRLGGATYRAIGAELGMTGERIAKALRGDGEAPAELVQKQQYRKWTEDELRAAAYLRSQGHTYNQIAAAFDYKSPGTVRAALTIHGARLGIDPVTGRTYAPGEPMPDPHRWAPRKNPWNGGIKSEDLAAVPARFKEALRAAKQSPSDRAAERGVDVQEVLDRAIARRRALNAPDGRPQANDDLLDRSINPIGRHRR